MLGQKPRVFKPLPEVCLDDLVPRGNFYRQVEEHLDLDFVRDLVCDLYAVTGRPSIDPVVFFKLQLIAFFEGIRSERQLMETVNMRLDHRWYIGYDLGEPVPDHSSLSKIRERYGLEVFHKFFERIVELCHDAGLVWGKELYFDGTKVRANAAIDGMVNRVDFAAEQHLQQLFPENEDGANSHEDAEISSAAKLVAKYNGKRHPGSRKPWYHRLADEKVSPTDPDATPMKPTGGGRTVLGYHDHYVVDGGRDRIILSALVTPASIMDNTPLLDMIHWVCSRWDLEPEIAVGDAKYGTAPNIAGLEKAGIKAYLPLADLSKRTQYYPACSFHYDAVQDQYLCPQEQILRLHSRRKSEQVSVYRADARTCNACPVKSECTGSKSGRHIFRPFHQEYIDRVKAYHETEAYQKAMCKRGVWVEPLFGEAKQFHRLRRFRLRRLIKVNIEGIMVAAGQNLKRLLKRKAQGNSENPSQNAQSSSACFFFVVEDVMKKLAGFQFGPTFSTG
jgi:transposase